jgi:hypothetical protein
MMADGSILREKKKNVSGLRLIKISLNSFLFRVLTPKMLSSYHYCILYSLNNKNNNMMNKPFRHLKKKTKTLSCVSFCSSLC